MDSQCNHLSKNVRFKESDIQPVEKRPQHASAEGVLSWNIEIALNRWRKRGVGYRQFASFFR
ncbi:MAG: hypothetical protein RRZ42_08390, partial [Oscillospiraceae bacterium]